MMDGMPYDKNKFEREFWGNCVNTYGEETKQLVYARRMRLERVSDWRSAFNFDMKGQSIIDIGGGPTSLLLKCVNVNGMVIDPLPFPEWVYLRYHTAGITSLIKRGEDLDEYAHRLNLVFDEAWIYNTLQHVDDPALIIKNARTIAKRIRLFEWINIPPHLGHPHMLTEEFLTHELGGPGGTEKLNEYGCVGQAFYGVWDYTIPR